MIHIRGTQHNILGLTTLLGGAAALTLAVEDGELTETAAAGVPSSARLREVLRTMMAAPDQSAQVDVDATAIALGRYAAWQELNVVNCVSVDAGADGLGVLIAIHEIYENYVAPPGAPGHAYGPAHAAALVVEGEVAAQLRGQAGTRVAASQWGGVEALAFALDYADYYAVLTGARQQPLTGAYRARTQLHEARLPDVTPGVRVSADRLDEFVQRLEGEGSATARVTGERTGAEGSDQAAGRAAAVRSALIVALDQDDYADRDGTGIELHEDRLKGAGADLGSRRPWAGGEMVVPANPGVRVTITRPA
jgi:hypothetical protein